MRKLKTNELDRISAEEFKATSKSNFVVVLDNIRSANNVGAAFRTGDAFKAERILLCGITSTPPHRDINKTALGAQDTVAWTHFEDVLDAINQLVDEGYEIVIIEQIDTSISLQSFIPDPSKKYAYVFGNEVKGISEHILEKATMALEIPQYGTKHSLNISVTIGITLWQHMANSL